MHRLWDRGRGVRQTAWLLIWPAAVLLCGLPPSAVHAGCIVNPDPEMRHIQRLIATDATQALKQLQDRMDAVRREAVATQGRAEQLASLYAVEAEAYGILERSAEARNSAAEGRKLATLPNDPIWRSSP
jgi:hypothetical protein